MQLSEPLLPPGHPLHNDPLVREWLPVLYRQWLAAGAPLPAHDEPRPLRFYLPPYNYALWSETYFWPNLLADTLAMYATGLRQLRAPAPTRTPPSPHFRF